jgi:hypothetical protein
MPPKPAKNELQILMLGVLIGFVGYQGFAGVAHILFVIDFIAGTAFQADNPIVFRRLIANDTYLKFLLVISGVANLVAGFTTAALFEKGRVHFWGVLAFVNVLLMFMTHRAFPYSWLIAMSLSILISCCVGALAQNLIRKT